ncbi:MAG: phosphoribosylformylglycinamidine cyclo-ligase, partial [Chloroflexota bacterium]|nr:phosphoribosylformylglycinamidine cyclo-ligase [Chloroflexota bacterium]
GVASACRENGCALLGGETAELPGVYREGEFDLAGFVTGLVERTRLIDGSAVELGDQLVALPSSGLHTNGFSLVFQVLAQSADGKSLAERLQSEVLPSGEPLRAALLVPHRSYLRDVWPLLQLGLVRGMAHITGGGLVDNVPRVLPAGMSAHIDLATWTPPEVFGFLQSEGQVAIQEMYRVFNMGVGMVLFVAPAHVAEVLERIPGAWVVGDVRQGDGKVVLSRGADA